MDSYVLLQVLLRFLHKGISGTAYATGIKVNVAAVLKGIQSNPIILSELAVNAVNIDFNEIRVDLDGLGRLLNPLANAIITSVKNSYKKALTDLISGQVKNELQNAVNKILPITVPL